MSIEDKKKRASELWKQYEAAKEVAQNLYREYQTVMNEIASSEAKFPVGSVIVIERTRFKTTGCGYGAKIQSVLRQEKYKITQITNSAVLADRIKKDGSLGAQKRLYPWDIEKAKLVEPPQ